MIHFKLKEPDQILPVGTEPNLSVSWFWLTDGDLWLRFGDQTIYEYSPEAMNYWGNKPTPYNDYPIIRFIEDFTELFDRIKEPLPEEFYQLTKDLKKFKCESEKWLDIYDENEHPDFYFETYDKLISWTYERTLNSGHLAGGPNLSFFRGNDIIRIVWETGHTLENGISVWSAKDGSYEMDYSDFIAKIKSFGAAFFSEMEQQVALAIAKDWNQVRIDKQRLIEEHRERKNEFYSYVASLEQITANKTEWSEIDQLIKRMKNELASFSR